MPLGEMARSLVLKTAAVVGYDITHITRRVAYDEISAFLNGLDTASMDALEISAGWQWQQRDWRSFTDMAYPHYDICMDRMPDQYDIIIADNVFEHLKYPYRAAQNVLSMLRPGGFFINITPFLIRHHPIPIDCSRWTEKGMAHFLEEAGFPLGSIRTGSWGNTAAVKANFHRWARTGFRKQLKNDSRFPVTVWAIAEKAKAAD